MASESSFDIVSQFDFQELKNAIDQVKREIQTRYDFKGVNAEVTLNDDDLVVTCPDTMKLQAVRDLIMQKTINRKQSPKIFDMQNPEPASGGTLRQQIKLVKVLDQETCKKITKLIKENFPKVKSNIQGETVRVSAKSKDDLQAVMGKLRSEEGISAPLEFTNYR